MRCRIWPDSGDWAGRDQRLPAGVKRPRSRFLESPDGTRLLKIAPCAVRLRNGGGARGLERGRRRRRADKGPGLGGPALFGFGNFGGGRRACVGASFAELETVLVLATIARRFRLELTARGMPAPVAQVTLRPGRNLPMRLRHR